MHVNRVIVAFKQQGLIQCGYKKLKVLDEDKLSTIGQFDINLIENPFRHFS
ncbi:helix-turn-helix domain-containing protein [Candidatus Thioglobus sp.]|uniref:helix-turn-helix domain-containing protein n=1 Tax=Candidatus Thioglobus sp. TaxID=2026721 RepID=UPI003D0BA604